MDCVEGAEGDSQALLTLHFVQIRFQAYVLLGRHDRAHVVAAPDWLEGLLGGPEAFRRVFGLILTDRGREFDDIAGIERNGRCRVFYVGPQRPDQKGACEKNHVELRKVIPKGTSIDGLGLDAWILAGVCSNVNSSLRRAIGDASPMALARVALPASLLEGLGLALVPPDEVETRPELVERLRRERDGTKRWQANHTGDERGRGQGPGGKAALSLTRADAVTMGHAAKRCRPVGLLRLLRQKRIPQRRERHCLPASTLSAALTLPKLH